MRKRLRPGKGDQVRYRTGPDGRVCIKPLRANVGDPALAGFLDLIEADITAHPEPIAAFGGALPTRLAILVGDLDVNLGEALSPDDE